jgi:hypothetical protein
VQHKKRISLLGNKKNKGLMKRAWRIDGGGIGQNSQVVPQIF